MDRFRLVCSGECGASLVVCRVVAFTAVLARIRQACIAVPRLPLFTAASDSQVLRSEAALTLASLVAGDAPAVVEEALGTLVRWTGHSRLAFRHGSAVAIGEVVRLLVDQDHVSVASIMSSTEDLLRLRELRGLAIVKDGVELGVDDQEQAVYDVVRHLLFSQLGLPRSDHSGHRSPSEHISMQRKAVRRLLRMTTGSSEIAGVSMAATLIDVDELLQACEPQEGQPTRSTRSRSHCGASTLSPSLSSSAPTSYAGAAGAGVAAGAAAAGRLRQGKRGRPAEAAPAAILVASTPHPVPVASLLDELLYRLFRARWECREGAAMALREVLTALKPRLRHASNAAGGTADTIEVVAASRVEDVATRCLAVLLVDRMSDFAHETGVAPVREAVAELLGTVAELVDVEGLQAFVVTAVGLCAHPDWQVRHGVALTLQHVAARVVAESSATAPRDAVVSEALALVGDEIDDVAAAGALAVLRCSRAKPGLMREAPVSGDTGGRTVRDACLERLAEAFGKCTDAAAALSSLLPLCQAVATTSQLPAAGESAAADALLDSAGMCRVLMPWAMLGTGHRSAAVVDGSWELLSCVVFDHLGALLAATTAASSMTTKLLLDACLRVCLRTVVTSTAPAALIAGGRCAKGLLELVAATRPSTASPYNHSDIDLEAIAWTAFEAACVNDGDVPVIAAAGCPTSLEALLAEDRTADAAAELCSMLASPRQEGMSADCRTAVCHFAAVLLRQRAAALATATTRLEEELRSRASISRMMAAAQTLAMIEAGGRLHRLVQVDAESVDDGSELGSALSRQCESLCHTPLTHPGAGVLWDHQDKPMELEEQLEALDAGCRQASGLLQCMAAMLTDDEDARCAIAPDKDETMLTVAQQAIHDAMHASGAVVTSAPEAAYATADRLNRAAIALRAVLSTVLAASAGRMVPNWDCASVVLAAWASAMSEGTLAAPGAANARGPGAGDSAIVETCQVVAGRVALLCERRNRTTETAAGSSMPILPAEAGRLALRGLLVPTLSVQAEEVASMLVDGVRAPDDGSGLGVSRHRCARSLVHGLCSPDQVLRAAVVQAVAVALEDGDDAEPDRRLHLLHAATVAINAFPGTVATTGYARLLPPVVRILGGAVLRAAGVAQALACREAAGSCLAALLRAGVLSTHPTAIPSRASLSSSSSSSSSSAASTASAGCGSTSLLDSLRVAHARACASALDDAMQRAREAVDLDASSKPTPTLARPVRQAVAATSAALDPLPAQAVPAKITLRAYQHTCIDWLLRMRDAGLGALLADDMGLGKTVQALAMIAVPVTQAGSTASSPSSSSAASRVSLVVCPSSLVRHWANEAASLFPALAVLQLSGSRAKAKLPLWIRSLKADSRGVVVVSYAGLRHSGALLAKQAWATLVFDEAHALRNPSSAAAIAARCLSARFRLCLTGTPVQNSPADLWALFDMLLPGLLGSRSVFDSAVTAIVRRASRGTATDKEHAAAGRVLARLHSLVRPFVIRRTKDQVLRDLPPKVIQDVPCELSSAQRKLYAEFEAVGLASALEIHHRSAVGDAIPHGSARGGSAPCMHPFTLIRKLRAICNHPSLLDPPRAPEKAETGRRRSSQTAVPIASSGKLLALHSILQQCGFGVGTDSPSFRAKFGPESGRRSSKRMAVAAEVAVGSLHPDPSPSAWPMLAAAALGEVSHRVLLFSQTPGMLQLVQASVLQAFFPHVATSIIDGTVPAGRRQAIADAFNTGSTPAALLLTTSTGGLGLNLSGADVVVFLDHDWNPMVDLQAMDRAHRLGQRRTVHVFRLVAQDTLEERIMGLQAFKRRVAASLVAADPAASQSHAADALASLGQAFGKD